MPSWEYRLETVPAPEALALLGREGWELVGLDGGQAYFKRPIPSYRERVTLAQRQRALQTRPESDAVVPRLLHPEAYRVFAAAGHTDLLTICDRGFPVPLGPERCDLAVADDLPTVPDILRLIRALFPPDRLVLPAEVREVAPQRVPQLRSLLPHTTFDFVPHTEFKELAATARATVRTGDSVPYANVIWVG